MTINPDRAGFEALAAAGADDDDAPRALAARLKAGPQPADLKALAALWIHGAAAAPERIPGIYDGACEGWLGQPVEGPAINTAGAAAERIPPEFWAGLWALLDAPRDGPKPASLSTRAAAQAGLVSPNIAGRVARTAMAYPGVQVAIALGHPKAFSPDALARCAPDSLAGEFRALIAANGLTLEPPARGGPDADKPSHDDLDARIRQCRDLWRIVAGYRRTALHEMALCGFQLAQFGHRYSAMFLAMALTRVAFEQPEGGPLMLETILTAWAHGRRTPPLLPVKWETVWDKPVQDVRARLGVVPYVSPFPADVFEQLGAAAAA